MSYQAPPWQAPPRRTGWNDPRLGQSQQTPTPGQQQHYQQPASAQSPISPINPQAFAYHPPDTQQPSYGAPSNFAGQYDTSTWGVKYNQNQSQPPPPWQPPEERPPLPPRPSSALQTTQPQQTTTPGQWQQSTAQTSGPPPQHHQQQPSWSQSYGQPPVYGQAIPPPPPPKPPVYEVQTQPQHYQQPSQTHDQYSHQPPTHQYDPQRQTGQSQHPYSAPQHQYSLHASLPGPMQDVAPVSPIEPDPHRWPSQQPVYGNHQPSVMQAPATPGEDKFYSTALGPYGGPSDWEHFGDGTTISPDISSPPKSHATPGFVAPQVSASPPPMLPQSDEPAPVVGPSRPVQNHQSSEASSVSSGGIKRSDTIDGVINAWSAPLKFAPKQGRIDESRPQSRESRASVHESPKERIVEVVKEVTKVVDPYEDMEPEFKASLKRYADMLRKESAAGTDEQKFAAFEAFIKKELRLRAMLYGMDSPLQLIKTQLRPSNSQSGEKPKEVSRPTSPPSAPAVAPVKAVNEPVASDNAAAIAPSTAAALVTEPQEVDKPADLKPEVAEESRAEVASPPPSSTAGLNLAALAAQLRDSPVQPSSGQHKAFDKAKAGTIPTSADTDNDDEQFSPGGRPLSKPQPSASVSGTEEAYSPGGRPLPRTQPASTAHGTEEAYSPGGRPIPLTTTRPTTASKAPAVPELTIPALVPSRPTILSPGANAPMVLSDYAMPDAPPHPSLPSPGANAPMLVEPSPVSASADAPQVVSPSPSGLVSKRSSTASGSAKKFEPARPAYTPFRYAPAVQGPIMSADKSYSSLRKDGLESGRFLKHDPTGSGVGSPARVGTPASGASANAAGLLPIAPLQPGTGAAGGKRMQDEAFIGLIRMQSKAVRKGGARPQGAGSGEATPPVPGLPIAALRPGTPAVQRAGTPGVGGSGAGTPNPTARTPTPAAMAGMGRAATPAAPRDLRGAVSALRSSLPASVPDSYGLLSRHDGVNGVKGKVDGFVDQFGFIHQTVLEWDKRNRGLRKRLDEERSLRQADSEARIDDLFNDNEIGYADIGELEAEFKLEEARRKYDEDKEELDSFTREVFDVVNERLRGEVEGLGREYERVVELLDERCEAAGRCLEGGEGQGAEVVPEMGIVMNLVLAIFNKMELRHQKLTEAAVERERRRKRLELTVLYTNGDTAGVKRLESEFAVAEKLQVLQEARARDVRANQLMDAFDRATVRGLGDNQEFVDQLLPRIRQVRELVMREDGGEHEEDVLYGPQGVRETLALAQKAVDFVLADSQKLLTIENVADKVLNEADYGVSVAEARVSDADRGTYQKLGEEKEKEDAKIVEDTGARMGAIGKGPEEAVELIREVVARIGDDPEHQARIRRALEAARKRNEGAG